MSSSRGMTRLSIEAITQHMPLNTRNKLARQIKNFREIVRFVPWNFEKIAIAVTENLCIIQVNSCLSIHIHKKDGPSDCIELSYGKPEDRYGCWETLKSPFSFENTIEKLFKFLWGYRATTFIKQFEMSGERISFLGNSPMKVMHKCVYELDSEESITRVMELGAPETKLKTAIDTHRIRSFHQYFSTHEAVPGAKVDLWGRLQPHGLPQHFMVRLFEELADLKPTRGMIQEENARLRCIVIRMSSADLVIAHPKPAVGGFNKMQITTAQPGSFAIVDLKNWVTSYD